MSITEILEKHLGTGGGNNALKSDLSQLIKDNALEFAYWLKVNPGAYGTTSELYALFLTNKTKEE